MERGFALHTIFPSMFAHLLIDCPLNEGVEAQNICTVLHNFECLKQQLWKKSDSETLQCTAKLAYFIHSDQHLIKTMVTAGIVKQCDKKKSYLKRIQYFKSASR